MGQSPEPELSLVFLFMPMLVLRAANLNGCWAGYLTLGSVLDLGFGIGRWDGQREPMGRFSAGLPKECQRKSSARLQNHGSES